MMRERKVFLGRGVGRRLFIAFLIVSLFSFGAAIFGSFGFSFVSKAQNEVLGEVYPTVQNAQQIALQSTALVLGLPALSNNNSIEELERIRADLKKQEANVLDLLEGVRSSKFAGEVFSELEPEVQILSDNFTQLTAISRETIEINNLTHKQVTALVSLTTAITGHARTARISFGDNIVIKAEKIRKAIDDDDRSHTVNDFDELVYGNVNAFKKVSDIQFRSETLEKQFFALEDINDLKRLKDIENNILLNLRVIANKLVRLRTKDLQRQFAAPVSNLSKLILGAESIFDLKEKLIVNSNNAEEIRRSTEQTGETVRGFVSKFVDEIQLTMDEKSLQVQKTTTNTQIALVVLALLSAFASALIYFLYINNNILNRLQLLYGATVRFNQGDFLVPVSSSGDDEITDLEGAIESFRLNSLKLLKTEKELKNQADDLKRSNQDLEQFAYVTSHDLRAPLRGLHSLSQWIEEDIEAGNMEEISENLKRMRGRVARMDALLNGILQYSRAGYEAEKNTSLSVKNTITNIFDDINTDDNFTLDLRSEVEEIYTKEAFFKQIACNLIANSIKHHNKETGTVSVEILQKDENYHLVVSDDGPGIPEQMRERVFKIFQTLKPQDEIEASGIGLSLVKRLVDRNKGQITLESSKSGGAMFTVIWPRPVK